MKIKTSTFAFIVICMLLIIAKDAMAGDIVWEIFKNETSYDFSKLKNTGAIPDQIIKIDSLNTINNFSLMDHFSSRIRGYLIPPVSGDYSFYFACDDRGEFWLSPDTTYANAQLKSEIKSMQTDWTKNISNQSLVAGQKYFFEIMHYDSVYTDLVKLGWKIPGAAGPAVIKTPYMVGCNDNVPVGTFSFNDHEVTAYPGWTLTPRYQLTPWNTSNKSIKWKSSDNSIATVNADGVVSTISQGVCRIIASMVENPLVDDSLQIDVINYSGHYFVKENPPSNGNGQSWDNAISLTKLLDILNQGGRMQKMTVYVAEGIYKPTTTIDRNKSFIINNLRMMGGYPENLAGTDTTNRNVVNYETILSGDIGIPIETLDNSYHVVITQKTVILDGFTIRDGRANSKYYGDENTYDLPENSGGGIFLESENTFIYNCKIINNSAYNGGAGIYCWSQSPVLGGVLYGKNLTIENSQISYNKIEQIVNTGGSMFIVLVNGFGAGIVVYEGTCNMKNCVLNNNVSPYGYGIALYMVRSTVNIEKCSFFSNLGYYEDLWNNGYSTLNMTNSTLVGRFVTANNSNSNIINSTIIGGGYTAFDGNHLLFDNSIWTDPNLKFYEGSTDNTWQAKYSILGNKLYGIDKESIISANIPDYKTWLDSIANNGGLTPTLKLKDIPNNPAKSKGNQKYLETADQRGVMRSDSVSIGAYQWVKSTGIATTEFCKSVKVYPNPFSNLLVIENTGNSDKTDFEIFNSIGQVIYNGFLDKRTVIRTTAFAPGMYLIKLKSGDTFEFKKVLKN